MDLTIKLTDDEVATLQRANEESNRGGIVPPVEEFAVSLLHDHIADLSNAMRRADVDAKLEELRVVAPSLTKADLAQISALAATKKQSP